MNALKFSVIGGAVAALLFGMPSAIGSAAQRVGQYDFTYLTSGEGRAAPVQVFDDGKNTYFQFRAGEAIPAIFQTKTGKPELLVPAFEGPYVRVNEIAGRFTLQLGRSQAHVVYGGGGREGVPQINAVASNGMTTPYTGAYPSNRGTKLVASLGSALQHLNPGDMQANSYATPVKGDRVTWQEAEVKSETHEVPFVRGAAKLGPAATKQLTSLAAAIKAANRITIIGRDDDTYKEGLEGARADAIRAALLKLGANSSAIVVRTGVAKAAVNGQWPSDIQIETVRPNMIARPGPSDRVDRAREESVRANVDGLVRVGALTQEQAEAILRSGESQRAPATSATQPQPVAQPVRNLEVPPSGFDFKVSDKTISNTVRRWAAATNYEVVWEAPKAADAPIAGDGLITSDSIKDALDKIVTGLKRKGYDLQATIYSNRVIHFTGSSK